MIYVLIADDRWYSDGGTNPILASPDKALLDQYAEHLNRFKVFPPPAPGVAGEFVRKPALSHKSIAERKRLLQEEVAKIAPDMPSWAISDWSSVSFEVEEVPLAKPGLLDNIYGDLLKISGGDMDVVERRLAAFRDYVDALGGKTS
ncbi:hypothetical protein HOU02_gp284 [Caulobacter phage CcrBL9]|uniref:Uncharacterized protein n=1 Tax=Caulobacter phage CcrBL9 TaxID=2283270 RepID=A0A385EC29_9CAUD|nr:hypothetical protein HOU02_gp284 [Caulobacter phage CcrBL9]AXQ69441.1 hypothetical protein CcrBL9_gp417 [Caulobacter phage CcrBL9]